MWLEMCVVFSNLCRSCKLTVQHAHDIIQISHLRGFPESPQVQFLNHQQV